MKRPELKDEKFRFLVTGGAGFIGSNVALELLGLGQRVVILDDLSTGKRSNIEKVESFAAGPDGAEGSLTFIEGDIRDRGVCKEATRGADYVLHNAALGSVPRSIDDPVTSTEVNLMGTVNMLTAAMEHKVRKFVYASSSSVYGDVEGLPKVEGREGRTLSPYATGKLADEMARAEPRVHVLHRPAKQGLGKAYLAGFRWALERGYDLVFEMDADFSHDPRHLPEFLEAAKDADLVLGSRYLEGRVTVVNWPMPRLLLSYFANMYARVVTGHRLFDATGGFKCYRRAVLEAIDLDAVGSNGYAFQIEMSFRARRHGFRIVEIPIVFVDRAFHSCPAE